MAHREEIRSYITDRDPSYSLPQSFYGDADHFALDLEAVWYRKWLFIGHTCEIAKAGDYLTVQIDAYPVVIVRGGDGTVRAFHNMCRHRGSRLCKSERGSGARLVCGYHQWTYDLEGKLLYARDMDKFNPADFGLKPVACEVVGGFIFVSLSDDPENFATFRNTVAPYIAPHGLENAKVAATTTIVEKGNWKLVLENNRECYHCVGSHPELCRVYDDSPSMTGIGAVGDDAAIAAHWEKCESNGIPSSIKMASDGSWRVVRSPFVRNAASMTMSGEPAVKRLLGNLTEPRLGSMMMFHYPNSWNHLLGDHAITFRVLPVSAQETLVTTKWLVHKDAQEGVDYDLETLTRVWNSTNDQDRALVEENQRGINSPAYEPGPYSIKHEGSVIQFLDWYAQTLGDHLASYTSPLRSVG
jgi:Rieske 2Fe-2S family protein